MSNKVTLISPPDILFNNCKSLALINLTEEEQSAVTDWLVANPLKTEVDIYFYNNHNDLTWLLTAYSTSKIKYINLNNTKDNSLWVASFLLSQPNSYYMCDDENLSSIMSQINGSKVTSIIKVLEMAEISE